MVNTFVQRLRIKRGLLVTIAIATTSLPFQNCSKAKFSGDSSASGTPGYGIDAAYVDINQPHTNGDSCYTFLHQTNDPVRMLFVVDQSGSNVDDNGTDPVKAVRVGSARAFLNDYQSKPGFRWGLIGFADTSAHSYVPGFFTDATQMGQVLTLLNGIEDAGNTPYTAALNAVQTAIVTDTSAPAATRYIVVFLSDGMPNPEVSDSRLATSVQAILNTKPGWVTFNTIYYGPGDKSASERLRAMATKGNGYFLDTNRSPTAKDFLISNVVEVPASSCVP